METYSEVKPDCVKPTQEQNPSFLWLVEISLYLNVLLDRARDVGGKLSQFLNCDSDAKLDVFGKSSEETQCLLFPGEGTVWLANNEDADTSSQMSFLEKFGISTYKDLQTHVKTHVGQLLSGKKGQLPSSSPKKLLLHCVAKRQGHIPDEKSGLVSEWPELKPISSKHGSIKRYKLDSPGVPPQEKGILCVTGKYEGKPSDGDPHAEQKLLAALWRVTSGKGFDDGKEEGGSIVVAGCKTACNVCREVLEEARGVMKKKAFLGKFILEYSDVIVEALRVTCKLSARKDVNGIRRLELE
jgi:hypothetical protein